MVRPTKGELRRGALIVGTKSWTEWRNDIFFFFQAEDGIRDLTVTGVQTCALPIFRPARHNLRLVREEGIRDPPIISRFMREAPRFDPPRSRARQSNAKLSEYLRPSESL